MRNKQSVANLERELVVGNNIKMRILIKLEEFHPLQTTKHQSGKNLILKNFKLNPQAPYDTSLVIFLIFHHNTKILI